MLESANLGENHARFLKSASYDGARYTKYKGYVTLSQIVMDWDEFIIHHDNIWHMVCLFQFIWESIDVVARWGKVILHWSKMVEQASTQSLSNVILVDKRFTSFHQYLWYWHKSVILPLCSVYQAPSYEPNLTLLGRFSKEFAYSSMLFIL